MRIVLDASTLVPLTLNLGRELLEVARRVELYVLDLTIYEVGNALWKLTALRKTMSLDDAIEMLSVTMELAKHGIVNVARFDSLEMKRVLEIAFMERLTFYDASYIVTAEKLRAYLATEDRELRSKASRYVESMDYSQLVKALALDQGKQQ